MLSAWQLNRRIWITGSSNKREIRKTDSIIREEKLADISRRLISSGPFESLVLVRGENYCAAALKRGNWLYPIQTITYGKLIHHQYIDDDFVIDENVIDDDTELQEALGFQEILYRIRLYEDDFDRILPKELPPVPEEILKNYQTGDEYGIYSETSYWWWQKQTGDLHIAGTGKADGFAQRHTDSMYYYSMLTEILLILIDQSKLGNVIIHEGITEFRGVDFTKYAGYSYDDADWVMVFKEIILPSTLVRIEQICCYAEKMIIPASYKTVNMWDFMNEMGGHWDPVKYCARTILIPSSVEIIEGFPYLEPISFLKNLEIYGDQPIVDLENWFSKEMLNTNSCDYVDKLQIVYPTEWDHGNPGSYADELMEFMKKKELSKPDWSKGNDMYLPVAEEEWSQEDFDDWRKHIQPKQQDKKPASSEKHENTGTSLIKHLENGNVQFGHYPQDTEKKAAPIEWRILEKNDRGMLLISQYGLDSMEFNLNENTLEWRTSLIRQWLNETFINEAFTEKEKELILNTVHQPDEKGDPSIHLNDVSDKLFLLDSNEAKHYLYNGYTLECEPTVYARRQGVRVDFYTHNCFWWLRSYSNPNGIPDFVEPRGEIIHVDFDLYLDTKDYAVRPAMWIGLNS